MTEQRKYNQLVDPLNLQNDSCKIRNHFVIKSRLLYLYIILLKKRISGSQSALQASQSEPKVENRVTLHIS